jgi:cyclic-di-GMP-binding biofilm dispersal mediator protein
VVGDFSGKNVLILGGSRGIGAAIVRRFAKGDGKVAFTYAGSKEAAEALAAETEAEATRADSTDRDALIATVAPSISWLALRVCSSWAIRLRSTPTPSTG